MVLENLGSKLKESLSKIARKIFVDEGIIDELCKEIQRALLSADVNVKLVFELTQKIKKRALEKKKSSLINERENLVNIVYEELANLLGGEKREFEISSKKRPYKIMFVGLYGSGKCVHKEAKVLLNDGSIVKIEDFYERYSNLPKEFIDNGEVINLSENNLYVPSFNASSLKIEDKKVTHLWKLKGNDLICVSLDNGNNFSVRVTPEHPFFALRKGKLKQIRADELNEDDFVAIPRTQPYNKTILIDLLEDLKRNDLDVYLDNFEVHNINGKNNLTELHKNLRFKRNYCRFTSDLKRGKVPIELVNSFGFLLHVKLREAQNPIYFPRYLTEELAEFLGYLWGDGHLTKRSVEIVNEDKEIIERVRYLFKYLFNLDVSLEKDLRTKAMYRMRIGSTTLTALLNSIFGISFNRKGRNLQIPPQLLISPKEVITKFLRAYFDCDASAGSNNRGIEITSESKDLIAQVSLLLLRFNILSTRSCKVVKGIEYYRLSIRAKYAENYADKIGFLVNHKLARVKNFNKIGAGQGYGKQDMIPLGTELKNLRQSLGFSIGQLQAKVDSYGRYEGSGFISRGKLQKLIRGYRSEGGNIISSLMNLNSLRERFNRPFVNAITSSLVDDGLIISNGNNFFLTNEGKTYVDSVRFITENISLLFAEKLAYSDVCWIRVKNTEPLKNDSEFVYDLTVEDNHSFIAEGIIVHNTTSIGKVGSYLQKRGLNICALGLDVHRAAAMDQLEQNCENAGIKCFIDKKEKNALKILDKFEKETEKFDVVLIDTAGRDALSKELLEEIKNVKKKSNTDEVILVISADIGQTAFEQAKTFHDNVNVNDVIITKMDGSAKAGGALSACAGAGAKVIFIGTGEKINDLETFNPKGFVGRLLGMGDLDALLKKVEESVEKEDQEEMSDKFLKGDFTLVDLHKQIDMMRKLGPLSKVMEMVPGFGNVKIPKEMLDTQDVKFEKWKHIMNSLTKEELENPEIIHDGKRVERIAKGAGINESVVKEMLKQYSQVKKVSKMLKGNKLENVMKKFGMG